MARKNYLIEGVSGSGKTSIATELERRGYSVVHGDRVLAYQGDPETGAAVTPRPDDPAFINAHHIWDVDRVKAIIADTSQHITIFCGASRNRQHFEHLFDAVFVLEADWPTIEGRLRSRVDEWGSEAAERDLVKTLHATRIDLPANAVPIDSTKPLADVVDAILARC